MMKHFHVPDMLSIWILVILIISGCAGGQPRTMDAEPYFHRGNARAEKGRYDQAIAYYTKAIEINPRFFEAYFFRGKTWVERGHLDRAIADYNKALEINPGNENTPYNMYYWRGRAWDRKGHYDRAITDFGKALEIEPHHANAHNVLAWILATSPDAGYRDGVKAVELAQKAVAIQPQYYGFWDTLASAYAEAGNFKDAIATQEKAIALLKKEVRGEKLDFKLVMR